MQVCPFWLRSYPPEPKGHLHHRQPVGGCPQKGRKTMAKTVPTKYVDRSAVGGRFVPLLNADSPAHHGTRTCSHQHPEEEVTRVAPCHGTPKISRILFYATTCGNHTDSLPICCPDEKNLVRPIDHQGGVSRANSLQSPRQRRYPKATPAASSSSRPTGAAPPDFWLQFRYSEVYSCGIRRRRK